MADISPTPWRITENELPDEELGQSWDIEDHDGETVAFGIYNKADAKLFIVAADLLEACKAYLAEECYLQSTAMHDNYTDRARSRDRQAKALTGMRGAVAKVTGKGDVT